MNETILLESRTLRTGVLERTEVLDRVKVLTLLPDGLHVTTAMVAAYYQVGIKAVESLVVDHREELEGSGYHVLSGSELTSFKEVCQMPSRSRSVAIFSRRAVLNVGMLLRDSEVARQVRTYLLDIEYTARTQPVDNFIHRPAFKDALRTQVVPMLNVILETISEHRSELTSLREDVEALKRRVYRTAALPRPHAGVMAGMDAMNWREFEHHVAGLLRRDGCTQVEVHGGHGDRGSDITAYTADGRRVAVQCKNFAPFRSILSGEMQKFLGSAKVLHRAEVALYVATCGFTREALAIAAETGITAVHRGLLEAWSAGTKLQVLR
ncbi:restriction endonuclease [Streptomyces sp. NBC_00239]|uniref:restriction endonuclease n=1 Tax=Streptomyces sp. NBC_00239 TaxID=2903640 RepID=UPI002E2B775A|nr:restriction endonuclease [Streptomyces sp. NBC_00239]